jgi:hypothetical protein
MSSPTEFFDVIYLGVFIILSPAFDWRFYQTSPPTNLRHEIGNAIGHFYKVIHVFSGKFTVLLDGEVIVPMYIVNRMLGEFAAAAVIFSQSIANTYNQQDESRLFSVQDAIECILKDYHPEVMAYYSHCVEQRHESFIWTGPQVDILRSSSSLLAVLSESTSGTWFDLPRHSIYQPETTFSNAQPSPEITPSASAPSTTTAPATAHFASPAVQSSGVERKGKRRASNGEGVISKRVRQ